MKRRVTEYINEGKRFVRHITKSQTMKTFLVLLCIVAAIDAECDQSKSYHTYNLWQGPSGAQLVLYGPPVLLIPWPAIMWQVTMPGCSPSAFQGKQDGQQYPCGLQWRLQERPGQQGDDKDVMKLYNSDGGKLYESKSSEEQRKGIQHPKGNLQRKTSKTHGDIQQPQNQMSLSQENDDDSDSDENLSTESDERDGVTPRNPAHDDSAESQSSEEPHSTPKSQKGKTQHKGLWSVKNKKRKASTTYGKVQKPKQQMITNNDEESEHDGSDETHSTESSVADDSEEARSSDEQYISPTRQKGKKQHKGTKWTIKHKQQVTSRSKAEIQKPVRQNTSNDEENENKGSGESRPTARDKQNDVEPKQLADEELNKILSSEKLHSIPKSQKGKKQQKGIKWVTQYKQQHMSTSQGELQKMGSKIMSYDEDSENKGSDETHSSENAADDESEESTSPEEQHLLSTRPKGKKTHKSIEMFMKHKQNKTPTVQSEMQKQGQQKTLQNYEENENKGSAENHSSEHDEKDDVKPRNPTDEESSDESTSSEEQNSSPKSQKGTNEHNGIMWYMGNKQQKTSTNISETQKPNQQMAPIDKESKNEVSEETHSKESDFDTSQSSEETIISPTDQRIQEQHKGNNVDFQPTEQSEMQKPVQQMTLNNEENYSRPPSEQDATLPSTPIDVVSDELRSAEHGMKQASGIGSKIDQFFRGLLGEDKSLDESAKSGEKTDLPATIQTEDEPKEDSSLEYEEQQEYLQNADQHEPENHGQTVQWLLNKKQQQQKSQVQQPSKLKPPTTLDENTSDETSFSESREDHTTTSYQTTTTSNQTTKTQTQRDNGGVKQWFQNKKPGQQVQQSLASKLQTTPAGTESDESVSHESEELFDAEKAFQKTKQPRPGSQRREVKWLWNKKQRQQVGNVKQPSSVKPSTTPSENASDDTSSSDSEENHTTNNPQHREQQVGGNNGRTAQWLRNKVKHQQKNKVQQSSTVKPSITPAEDTSDDTSSSESEESHTTTTLHDNEQQGQEEQGGAEQRPSFRKQTESNVQHISTVNASTTSVEDVSGDTSSSESEEGHATNITKQTGQQGQGYQGGVVVQWLRNKKQRQQESKVQQYSTVKPATTPAGDMSDDSSSSESEESQTITIPRETEQQGQENQGGGVQLHSYMKKRQRGSNIQKVPSVKSSTSPVEDASDDTSSSESEEGHATNITKQTGQQGQGYQGGVVVQWLRNKKQRQQESKVQQYSTVKPSTTPAEDMSDDSSSSESGESHTITIPQETEQQAQENQDGGVQLLRNKKQRQGESNIQQVSSVKPSTTPVEDVTDDTSSSESEESHATNITQQIGQHGRGDQGGVVTLFVNKVTRQREAKVQQPSAVSPSTTQTENESDESVSVESEELHTLTSSQQPESGETSPSESDGGHTTIAYQVPELQIQGEQGGVAQPFSNKIESQQESEVQLSTSVIPEDQQTNHLGGQQKVSNSHIESSGKVKENKGIKWFLSRLQRQRESAAQ